MKKTHLILAAILATSATVSLANDISQFEKELALTPEQKTKLEAIAKVTQEKVKIHQEQIRAILAETNVKVREVLTPEQYEKLKTRQQKQP